MKQSFLLFTFLLAQSIQAQVLPYNFSVEQGTYTPLTNATSVNNGQVWDDLEIQAPLGFSFTFFGKTTSTLYLNADFSSNMFGLQTDPTPLIISYGADLIDRGFEAGISQSPISYKTEGTPGSRIFKIQWANAGFYDDLSGTAFTNTQLWVFEGSNNVEFHFGQTQISNQDVFGGYTGPLFGFIDKFNFLAGDLDNLWYLTGPVNNPTVESISSVNELDTLYQTVNGAPGAGLIYRFATGVVALDDPQQPDSQVRIFPSIAVNTVTIEITDELAVDEKEMRYEISDQTGKKVRSESFGGTQVQVDISALSSGLYYIRLFSSGRVLATKKIVKQ